jgi:hypothetical protein
MLALALIALVLSLAAVARLVAVVHADRPLTPPRSHGHQVDPFAVRILRGS